MMNREGGRWKFVVRRYMGKGLGIYIDTYLIIINLDVFRVRFFNCFKCFELGEESVCVVSVLGIKLYPEGKNGRRRWNEGSHILCFHVIKEWRGRGEGFRDDSSLEILCVDFVWVFLCFFEGGVKYNFEHFRILTIWTLFFYVILSLSLALHSIVILFSPAQKLQKYVFEVKKSICKYKYPIL